MDPKHSGEIFEHLKKQGKFLKGAKTSMIEELEKLQIEEKMLMRCYELVSAQGLNKKKDGNKVSRALFNMPSDG